VKRERRTLGDDIRWALAVLLGFAIGAVLFGAHASVLIGAVIGATLVVAFRAVRRRRQTR
jgi:hypothetical protein